MNNRSKAQFVCGDLGNLDVPGDETNPRLPGQTPYVSLNGGSNVTWGHTLPGLLPIPGQSLGGAAVQSYPEPYVNPGSGLSINPADYDGNLQLATVETAKDEFYSVSATTRDMKCLARFDDNFDLGVWESTTASGNSCVTGVSMVTTAQLSNSLLHPTTPNTLYPDGVYSESGRCPSYCDRGNDQGYHGVLSLWVKSNYEHPADHHDDEFRGSPYVMRTNRADPTPNANPPGHQTSSLNQFFFIGQSWAASSLWGLCSFFEVGQATSDLDMEHQFSPPGGIPVPHCWFLATALWDFRSAGPSAKNDTGRLYFNDGAGTLGDIGDIYGGVTNTWDSASDITADDLKPDGTHGAHLTTLGALPGRDDYRDGWFFYGSGPDATFDEFGIWDFGGAPGGGLPAPPDSLNSAGVLAKARFREGRYYKGSAYKAPDDPTSVITAEAASYVTAPLRLPGGARLWKLQWTWYRPQDLPTDYAEMEILTPAADQYLWGASNPALSRSTLGEGWTRDRQSWTVNGVPPGPFRIRIVFRRETTVDDNTPILDSPVLDDLTLLYWPSGAPSVLYWEDVE